MPTNCKNSSSRQENKSMDGKPTYADLEKKIAAPNAELAAQKAVAAQYRIFDKP